MKSSLPILFDCNIFGLQAVGGVSNYWARLLDYFSEDPDLAARLLLPQKIKYLAFNKAWYLRAPPLVESLPASISRYCPVFSADSHEVFHSPYYRLPASKVGKFVVTVHDFTYERYRSGLARQVHSLQKFSAIRKADAVICVSENTKRDVLKYLPDIDEGKLFVVPLAVDHQTFYVDRSASKSELERTVLFVGQRVGYKRFELAMEALGRISTLRLGIVGPPLTPQEESQLSRTIGDRWVMYGTVANDELRRLYSGAFALVFPSDYEGFGLPILEAMACGCPVVCANRSSLPEVGSDAALYAKEQRAEAYVEPLKSLMDFSLRQRLSADGLLRASQFHWATHFEQTKAIYLGHATQPLTGQRRQPISVCLASYNGERYIAEQLVSILAQIDANDEVVICDDQSTDGTEAVVASIGDARIHWTRNEKRLGVAANFERAIRLARYPIIFLADQDDVWLSGRVEKMVSALTSVDMVISDCAVVDENLTLISRSFFQMRNSGRGFARNLMKNSYQGCCMAFRRELLIHALPFPKSAPMHDWWLGLVAERWGRSCFLAEPLLLYRRHSGNASLTTEKSNASGLQRLRWRWTLVVALLVRSVRRAGRA